MEFEECCPDCDIPGDDCPPVWGNCNHAFHMHCLLKWLESQGSQGKQQCPMCRADWVFRGGSKESTPREEEAQQVQRNAANAANMSTESWFENNISEEES